MKTCFKCLTEKPISEFYKHAAMADGHLGKCKECTKKDSKAHYAFLMTEYESRERELLRQRIKSRKSRLEGRQSPINKEKKRAWFVKNRHKRYAQALVARYIRTGKMSRKPCEICGCENAHAHHEDYGKPLDVTWLCTKHHAERHIALRQARERESR